MPLAPFSPGYRGLTELLCVPRERRRACDLVRRRSPDLAEGATEGLLELRETCGQHGVARTTATRGGARDRPQRVTGRISNAAVRGIVRFPAGDRTFRMRATVEMRKN